MNEGDSAGRRRNSTSPPAVADRRSTQISSIASAAPVSQMSQLPTSRLSVQPSDSQNTNDSCSSGSSNSIITGSTAANSACVKGFIGDNGGGSGGGNANILRSHHALGTAPSTPTSSSSSSSGSANNGNGTGNEFISTNLSPLYTAATVTVSNVGHTSVAQTSTASTTTIAKKRSANNTEADSIINYKKRNLNYRVARLKQIKDKHSDHVAEFYFLQIGGSMMEYIGWRKKANTPDFLNFIKRYRLDSPPADTAVTTTTTAIVTVPASIAVVAASPADRSTKVRFCCNENSWVDGRHTEFVSMALTYIVVFLFAADPVCVADCTHNSDTARSRNQNSGCWSDACCHLNDITSRGSTAYTTR